MGEAKGGASPGSFLHGDPPSLGVPGGAPMSRSRTAADAALLLVDDDRLVTDALVAAFDREPDMHVAATAASVIALKAVAVGLAAGVIAPPLPGPLTE